MVQSDSPARGGSDEPLEPPLDPPLDVHFIGKGIIAQPNDRDTDPLAK